MLDDNSKKFIKETIEDAIDKKLDDREKKTQASKRLDDLKYEKRSLQDRKKLLAELQTRDKKGENTIAQKFEMMKLAVDNVIPQDIKDAYKSTAKTIGNGASQIGQGINHLTERAMLSNPITAFLYNNRDILGAVGDIGIGTAKMGWSTLKGIGHGALGLANSAVNLFKPKQEEEDTEEETEKLNIKPPIFNGNDNNGGITKIAKQKADWQLKIDKIHEVVTKLKDGNTKSSSLLAKGLKGINDSMNAVKGFVDTIVAKQKLILGGVMLGAVAILGLAMWFQSGGLANLLDKDGKVTQDKSRKVNHASAAQEQYNKAETLINNPQQFVKEINDSSIIGNPVNVEVQKTKKRKNTQYKMTFDKDKQLVPAPFTGIIRDVKTGVAKTSQSASREYTIDMVGNNNEGVWLIHHVYDADLFVYPQMTITKGDAIGYTGEGKQVTFEHLGGNDKDTTKFTNDYKQTIQQSNNNQVNIKQKAINNLSNHKQDILKSMSANLEREKAIQKEKETAIVGSIDNLIENKSSGADQKNTVPFRENLYDTFKPDEQKDSQNIKDKQITQSGVSVNQQKAKDQNEQLNKPQEKTDKTSNNISTNPVEQPKTNLVATLPSQNIPYDFADLRSTGDINLMTSNGTTNTGVIVT